MHAIAPPIGHTYENTRVHSNIGHQPALPGIVRDTGSIGVHTPKTSWPAKTAGTSRHVPSLSSRARQWVLLLLALSCSISGVTAIEVDVGGETVVIPTPLGFVEGRSVSDAAQDFAEQLTPSMNRLLAFFVSEDDAERLQRGEPATWQRYMMVQTERQSEAVRIAPDDFFALRNVLTSQQKTLQSAVSEDPKTVLDNLYSDLEAGIKVGESVPLGIFSQDQAHISMAGLVRYQTANRQPSVTYVVANATNVLNPANRILFVYVYSGFHDREDLEWVEATSINWTRTILAANPNSSSAGLIDWVRTGSEAIWGGVVGATAVVGFLLFRRRRRLAS
jgi:hypothetical protein